MTFSRYGFPRHFSNKTMIANPLPTEMDEKTKDIIMENRKLILNAVTKGLNNLAEDDETYDENKNEDEEEVEVDELPIPKDKDEENRNKDKIKVEKFPNSIQAAKFLEEMCCSSESDKNEGENPNKESNKKPTIDINQALKDFKTAIEKVGLLKNLDKNEKVNIYQNALSISERGRNVILKRKISERNINNYNKLFHSVWQANTDIQLGLDTHAVISYISDYVTKSDQGITKVLVAALNEKKNCTKFEQLNHVKRVYFTHKQTCVSEAGYRLIPGLNLKESNIKTMFLTSGFPENRRQYLRQIPEDERQNEGIEIEGREGKFQTGISKIELYSSRPKDENSVFSYGQLENLCFAEYCMNYDKVAEKDLPKMKYKWEELYEINGEIVSSLVDKDIKNFKKSKLVCGIGYEHKLEDEELEGLPKYFFFVTKGTYLLNTVIIIKKL